MSIKRLVLIMIIAICSFMFSTAFGFTPLTSAQLLELQNTLNVQVKNGDIKISELEAFVQRLGEIKKMISQWNRDHEPRFKNSIYYIKVLSEQHDFVLNILKTQENINMINQLKLAEHFKDPANDFMAFVQDLENISESIKSITRQDLVDSAQ